MVGILYQLPVIFYLLWKLISLWPVGALVDEDVCTGQVSGHSLFVMSNFVSAYCLRLASGASQGAAG